MTGADVSGSAPGRAPPAIELRAIAKSFGHVQANQDIDLVVEPGTIHGIVGENGAGKSTLMNTLYGLHQADAGEILINGAPAPIRSSADAIGHGIGMVHQHFMLVPNFSVLENVMLGSEGGPLLAEGREKILAILEGLASDYGMTVDPHALAGDLPVGLQQRVEIIKALKGGARILILDEPTGVLTPQEAESLFRILDTLRQDGVTVLLITHKLEEIMAATDNVSIMRQGRMVGHRATRDTNPEELAELMVGRKVLLRVDRGTSSPGETRLSVEQLGCVSPEGVQLLDDISFEVRSGEILGTAGIAGNGQSELLEVLAGMRRPDWGRIRMMGTEITPDAETDPDETRKRGVAHIPEDRHRHGLVLGFTARENAILGYHRGSATGERSLIDATAVTSHCEKLMAEHDVRPPNPELRARSFSGGNQQKLVIARELDTRPDVLIVGQPTRGVDIGAIEFIHKELIALRGEGAAIVLVSVELEEILGLSDRIMVMNAGRLVGIVDRHEANERTLGLMMAGIGAAEDAA
ncbi:MAG: ABC transporter ATP-binding protein [Pseudomonadota bacterium]